MATREVPWLLMLALLCAPAPPVQAQMPSPPDAARAVELLTDPAALAAWMEAHNPDVLAAAARVGQARADAAQSRLLQNPTLSASLGDVPLGVTNPPGLAFQDAAIYSVGLTQTLEIGKRGPRAASGARRLDAAEAGYRDALGQAMVDARDALGRVVYLENRQNALAESLASARQVLDLQRLRFEKGDLSGNDYDRLHIDTLGLEDDVAQSRDEYGSALRGCAVLLGAPCDPEGADLSSIEGAAAVPPLPAALDEVFDRRPDLVALAATEASSNQDALLARRRRIPDPTLAISYTRDHLVISGDQPKTFAVSVAFPLPLFDRGQNDAARAELRSREIAETRRAARARARADLDSLLARREYLEAALSRLRDDAVPRSKGVLASTIAAVNEGELSMTDLLLARRSNTELTLKLMQLQFDAFSVRNRLRQSLGADASLSHPIPRPSGSKAAPEKP